MPIELTSNIQNDSMSNDLPQWQKDIIDRNLQAIADNPLRLHSIESLLDELDHEI